MRWSGVGIDEWWGNEKFYVIGGVFSHLFAAFQGLLKVLTCIDTNFTVTSKASDESGEFAELYVFKWTTLLIPPTTLIIVNIVGVVDVHIPRFIDSKLSNDASSTRSQGRFGAETEYALDNSTTSLLGWKFDDIGLSKQTNTYAAIRPLGGRQVISNNDLEWGREWGDVMDADLQHAGLQPTNSNRRSEAQRKKFAVSLRLFPVVFLCAVLCGLRRREGKVSSVVMGVDPVTTEPSVLKIVDFWSDDKVSVNGLDFSINEALISEASGLPKEGEVITRDKTNQKARRVKKVMLLWLVLKMWQQKVKSPSVDFEYQLAKCSRRSTYLQKKSANKSKIVDFVDSSKEDHTVSEVGKFGEEGNSLKVAEADPVEKGPAKGPYWTQTLIEELRCNLKVLNGLGGSLSSTCACINLLTLEITNYLKEVVKNLKDLSAVKE
eukprot:Gb_02440 [translate_table: standard]